METMIKRMAAVVLMAFVGLGLAVSPSFAADEPASSATDEPTSSATCDETALDPNAMFAYLAAVEIPEAGYPVDFCEVWHQNVPAGKFVFHYEPPAAGFHPTMS